MRGPALAVALLAPLVAGVAKPSVSAAWYTGWHMNGTHAFPLDEVPWDKYTHLTYSFAVTTPSVHSLTLNGSNPAGLPEFVAAAKFHGVKALCSIGGWDGGRWWSTDVGNAANRTAFVKTVLDFVEEYDLDGIDIDWEYPNDQGIGCNTISPKDTDDLLAFLQELRATPVGRELYLTAAAPLNPWDNKKGNPSKNLSAFAEVLDHIAIMNYDVWGPWAPTVGPNAPLNDSCAPPAEQWGSAVSAVAAWHAAGIPYDQLVVGVATYGHSFSVARADALLPNGTLALYPPFNASAQPLGDAWDTPGVSVDECGNVSGPSGSWDFWGLMEDGWLTRTGAAAPGIHYVYDECSQTPFVYNATSQIMVSFDNERSFAAKGAWLRGVGLKGFAIWEAGADEHAMLLNSIRAAAGFY